MSGDADRLRRSQESKTSSSHRRRRNRPSALTTASDPDTLRDADRPNIAAGLPPISLEDDVDSDTDDSYMSDFSDPADEENEGRFMCFGWRPYPRTPWSPRDSSLRPVPPLYPPLDPSCATYVGDASPSVVAARIAECLRKRSVVAEYDDEAATCTGMAYDGGVRFHIKLYRGGRGRPPPGRSDAVTDAGGASQPPQPQPDFSGGVIVECQRIRGDIVAFHRTCSAILLCASGNSDGTDDLRLDGPARGLTPPGSFSRCSAKDDVDKGEAVASPLLGLLPKHSERTSSSISSTREALELSLDLLCKDRLDAQMLGMESLVHLTDARVSGVRAAVLAGLAVIGAPATAALEGDDPENNVTGGAAEEILGIDELVLNLVIDRQGPLSANASGAEMSTSILSSAAPARAPVDTNNDEAVVGMVTLTASSPEGIAPLEALAGDAEHAGALRGLALRALANALTVLSSYHSEGSRSRRRLPLLRTALCSYQPCHRLVGPDVVSALIDDLGGASRPPSAIIAGESAGSVGLGRAGGSGLGSAHDAALSARCLRLLAENSEEAKGAMLAVRVSDKGSSAGGKQEAGRQGRRRPPVVVEALSRARLAGRARHAWLEQEAGAAFADLTGRNPTSL